MRGRFQCRIRWIFTQTNLRCITDLWVFLLRDCWYDLTSKMEFN